MDYGQVLTRSFSIVWRHRYLWLLAILGGADVGSGFGGFSPQGSTGSGRPPGAGSSAAAAGGSPDQLGRFLADNLGLLVWAVVIALLLAVAWFLLSCITTG